MKREALVALTLLALTACTPADQVCKDSRLYTRNANGIYTSDTRILCLNKEDAHGRP